MSRLGCDPRIGAKARRLLCHPFWRQCVAPEVGPCLGYRFQGAQQQPESDEININESITNMQIILLVRLLLNSFGANLILYNMHY